LLAKLTKYQRQLEEICKTIELAQYTTLSLLEHYLISH